MSSAPTPGDAAAPAPSPAPAPGSATPVGAAKSSKKTSKPTVTKASGAGTKAKVKKSTVRKKKPASKASSAANSQAVLNDARAATADLAKMRAQAAAKRSDPLWYRIEDILPVVQGSNVMTGSTTSILPEQAQVVEAALGHNGLKRADVTPQAMACLLEQARRFAQELISNAQDYAYSANRPEVTKADLMLAYEMRADHPMSITTQLPRLNTIAQQVNRSPLPPIPSHCYSGILLPPKQQQLTARTFDVVNSARVAQKMVQKIPAAPRKKSSSSNQPSYGASRGRQIPIKLKESQDSATPMDTTSEKPQAPTPSTTS